MVNNGISSQIYQQNSHQYLKSGRPVGKSSYLKWLSDVNKSISVTFQWHDRRHHKMLADCYAHLLPNSTASHECQVYCYKRRSSWDFCQSLDFFLIFLNRLININRIVIRLYISVHKYQCLLSIKLNKQKKLFWFDFLCFITTHKNVCFVLFKWP